jgi:hypothetical protein
MLLSNRSTLTPMWTNRFSGTTTASIKDDTARFTKLVDQIVGKRLTYAELTGKESQKANLDQEAAGAGPAEGLTFRFGPLRLGFNSACFWYSASRRSISALGTVNTRSTKRVKLSNSGDADAFMRL